MTLHRNYGWMAMAGLTAVAMSAPGVWAQAAAKSGGMPEVTAMPLAMAVPMQPVSMGPGQETREMQLSRQPVVEYPGEAHGGYLGVGVADLNDDRVAALKLKQAGGVEVVALDHDGPAAKAGIHEHDVILQMNGQEIAGAEQLRRMLRETPAGRKAEFQVSRDGQEMKVEVVLGDRTTVAGIPPMPEMNIKLPNMQNLVPAMDIELTGLDNMDMGPMVMMGPGYSGAVVESLGPQLATYFGAKDGVGVLVKEVRKDSPAGKSGMRAGDVIVSAAGQPVSGRGVWDHVLWDNRGKAVPVQILREKRPVTISLRVPEKTEGRLTPESFVVDASELPQVAELSADEEAAIKLETEQAQQEVVEAQASADAEQSQFNSEETKKAMAEAQAEVAKAQAEINSPEFKQEMEEAKREAEKAAAQVNSAEFKKQMQEVKRQVEVAKAQINSPEFKQQMEEAKREAEKAAAQINSPEFKKQMREVQEQVKKAQEEMERQTTPMD
jgi:serine protease Do